MTDTLTIAGKIAVFGTVFGAIAITVSVIWMTPLPLFIAGVLFAISATALKVAEKWRDQND